MPASAPNDTPFTIAHATDLDPDGGIAFRHSVALAREARAALYSMHANPVSEDAGRQMPDANEILRNWHWKAGNGIDAPSIEYHKMLHTCCEDPVDTLLDGMRQIKPDLLIVGKHPSGGAFELLRNSVSESMALNLNIPTLFLPIGGQGFVSEEAGELELRRVLLPVQDEATFLEAFDTTRKMLERLGKTDAEIILLHVGDDAVLDDLVVPESELDLKWRRVGRDGVLAEEIVKCIDDCDIDLIAMGTRGHDSLGDIFRGSHTERVIRKARCAVLSVPLTR